MGDHIIRRAVPDDEPLIRSCAEEAYTQYVAAIGRKPMPMIADFAAHIADDQTYVISRPEAPLDGFIVFSARGDHLFLENVAVRPVACGQGLGKSLIAFCEAQARKLGLKAIELYTNEKMTENQSLYPHLGYIETHRGVEYGFNRIYYRKLI